MQNLYFMGATIKAMIEMIASVCLQPIISFPKKRKKIFAIWKIISFYYIRKTICLLLWISHKTVFKLFFFSVYHQIKCKFYSKFRAVKMVFLVKFIWSTRCGLQKKKQRCAKLPEIKSKLIMLCGWALNHVSFFMLKILRWCSYWQGKYIDE